ncbi:MAG: hypothetical protein BMS9Abin07_0003 [Acidimicrobiia bacterium]|nr:MAG: hypothetical protein BMS9Abin07_0003 [Acidimicrobiia bacterium]
MRGVQARGDGVDRMSASGDDQRGAILPLMAIMLVVLLGAAAMAVDLGWLYWQSIEIQHGADASALAGVVYEPDFRTEAHTEAVAAAAENGYVDGASGATVTVVDFTDDPTAVDSDSMLRVTVTVQVQTFFMKVFGLNNVDIGRTAVAEYVQPLPMGSPDSYFGNDPAQQIYTPGFIAHVDGSYVGKGGGDRFGALCAGDGHGAECRSEEEYPPGTGGAQTGLNPDARTPLVTGTNYPTTAETGGYLYGIEVPAGSSGLKVEIFSAPIYAIYKNRIKPKPPTGTGNFHGDIKYLPPVSCCKQYYRTVEARTWYMLYGPDPTPGDSTDGNELLCSIGYDERNPTGDFGVKKPPTSTAYLGDFGAMGWDKSWLEFDEVRAAGYQNILDAMWDNMSNSFVGDAISAGCSSSFDRGPGIYLLRVVNRLDTSGEANIELSPRGTNRYSLRVSTTTGTQPTISGIGDMAMAAARNTTQTEFYLARVDQKYAGRSLVVELWDVGDITEGPGTDNFSLIDGTGAVQNCSWIATDTSVIPGAKSNPTSGGPGACTIGASDKIFNDELITITAPIPETYTCTGDACWWKIQYNYVGLVKDTTTWKAYIDGNPIRIVE